MKKLIIAAIMACIFMTGCLATNQISKYDTGAYDDCLIYQVAQKRGMRIEDMGNMVRLVGAGGRISDTLTPKTAIEIYDKIETALSFPITGELFVAELSNIAGDYGETAEIVLIYAPDFAVPYKLDQCTVKIMIEWCQKRKAFYKALS